MEPSIEQQIMMQLLGPDFGRVLFAFTTLVGNAAQIQQTLSEQTQRIAQLEAMLPQPEAETAAPAPAQNPWTGPEREGP